VFSKSPNKIKIFLTRFVKKELRNGDGDGGGNGDGGDCDISKSTHRFPIYYYVGNAMTMVYYIPRPPPT